MPEELDKTDLAFHTTIDLIDELLDRSEIGLITLIIDRTHKTCARWMRWKNGPGAIGLVRMAEHEIIVEWSDAANPINKDEDHAG